MLQVAVIKTLHFNHRVGRIYIIVLYYSLFCGFQVLTAQRITLSLLETTLDIHTQEAASCS